jgi:hypothetical protein
MAALRVPCVASFRLCDPSAGYNVSLRPLAAASLCWLVLLLHWVNGSSGIGPLLCLSGLRLDPGELHRLHGCGGLTGSVPSNGGCWYL